MHRLFVLLIGMLLFSGANASSICHKNIVIGWESWAPYQYIDDSGELTGLDIQLARSIFKHLGCDVVFIEMPWKRHLKDLEEGKVDVALGASFTEQRAKTSLFSAPYRQEVMSLFVRNENTQVRHHINLEQYLLSGATLGVTLGYFYGAEFERLAGLPEYSSLISRVRNDSQLFQMMEAGRIEGFLADPFSVFSRMSAFPEIDHFYPAFPVYSTNIHFMLSKRVFDGKMLAELNRAMETLREQGKLGEVISTYQFR